MQTILQTCHSIQYGRYYESRVTIVKKALETGVPPPWPDIQRESILVCASSNTALDEVVERVLMNDGFTGSTGQVYLPRITRIDSRTATLSASAKMVCDLLLHAYLGITWASPSHDTTPPPIDVDFV